MLHVKHFACTLGAQPDDARTPSGHLTRNLGKEAAMPNDILDHNSLMMFKHAARSLTAAMVVLAGVTGLLWPHETLPRNPHDIISGQPEDVIEPLPVRTLTFREGGEPMRLNAPGLPEWLGAEERTSAPPAWTVRADGLWVPWTMQPPAWLATIAGNYVVAETVPLPPERPMDKTSTQKGEVLSIPAPPQKRIATPDGGLCAKHGLRQVWTSATHWRCRP